jgi:hypothetical protein
MGCACDAYKLLLSNIPASVSESTLLSALSQFGHVAQVGLSPDVAGVSLLSCAVAAACAVKAALWLCFCCALTQHGKLSRCTARHFLALGVSTTPGAQ